MMPKFGHHRNDACRMCGSTDLTLYLDLGDQPPSNAFLSRDEIPDEQSFPLSVYLCRSCGLSQLLDVVHGEDVFDAYAYLSSTSRALVEHYGRMVDNLVERYEPSAGSLIIDVGANDGITLDRYPAGLFKLIGIEPSSAGELAEGKGHIIVKQFFDGAVGREILDEHGPATLVTATNVCAHVDDIRGFMAGFAEVLSPRGVVVFEFPYLVDMIDQGFFDTIYHEHLCYHALTPLAQLFEVVGLAPLWVERVNFGASGPALRLAVGQACGERKRDRSIDEMLTKEQAWGIRDPERYRSCADQVQATIVKLRGMIDEARAKGMRVGAYSAPAKGNTLLNAAGLDSRHIEAVAENNERKIGNVTPGSHIPIVSDQDFLSLNYDLALLLSWNYAAFFVERSDFVKTGGKFLVPLPEPVIVP